MVIYHYHPHGPYRPSPTPRLVSRFVISREAILWSFTTRSLKEVLIMGKDATGGDEDEDLSLSLSYICPCLCLCLFLCHCHSQLGYSRKCLLWESRR